MILPNEMIELMAYKNFTYDRYPLDAVLWQRSENKLGVLQATDGCALAQIVIEDAHPQDRDKVLIPKEAFTFARKLKPQRDHNVVLDLSARGEITVGIKRVAGDWVGGTTKFLDKQGNFPNIEADVPKPENLPESPTILLSVETLERMILALRGKKGKRLNDGLKFYLAKKDGANKAVKVVAVRNDAGPDSFGVIMPMRP